MFRSTPLGSMMRPTRVNCAHNNDWRFASQQGMDPGFWKRRKATHTKDGKLKIISTLRVAWFEHGGKWKKGFLAIGCFVVSGVVAEYFSKDINNQVRLNDSTRAEYMKKSSHYKGPQYLVNERRVQNDPDFYRGRMLNPVAAGCGIKELREEDRTRMFKEDKYNKEGLDEGAYESKIFS